MSKLLTVFEVPFVLKSLVCCVGSVEIQVEIVKRLVFYRNTPKRGQRPFVGSTVHQLYNIFDLYYYCIYMVYKIISKKVLFFIFGLNRSQR